MNHPKDEDMFDVKGEKEMTANKATESWCLFADTKERM